MTKLPRQCPACDTEMIVTQLICSHCGTEVRGRFQLDLFSRLSPNDFDFVVLFLKTKGNIKEMERELGISYWTIRSKLNEIVAQLELEAARPDPVTLSDQRQAILERLNAGALSVQEAAEQLERLKK